jgi:hypothetical protein
MSSRIFAKLLEVAQTTALVGKGVFVTQDGVSVGLLFHKRLASTTSCWEGIPYGGMGAKSRWDTI